MTPTSVQTIAQTVARATGRTTALAGAVTAWALACPPVGWAEPADPSAEPIPAASGPAPGPVPGPAPGPVAIPGQSNSPVAQACAQFDAALSVAAVNYEEFAYATAGNGNFVDYQDPNVEQSNVIGRTALRTAAATALAAAGTPGLPPDVADPMRSWSLRATKLIVIMGLRGGGDSLNATATQLNTYADEALLACAANGGRG